MSVLSSPIAIEGWGLSTPIDITFLFLLPFIINCVLIHLIHPSTDLKSMMLKAHVRGHQVRKKYKPIIWSVGILEKVILRWRRKGSGLRGFRSDAINKVPNQPTSLPEKEDDYDFLKEGRKQSEQKFQKALLRVKSMVQYPEARAQYRRLLNVVDDYRQTKVFSKMSFFLCLYLTNIFCLMIDIFFGHLI
jgi:hypothetical protein